MSLRYLYIAVSQRANKRRKIPIASSRMPNSEFDAFEHHCASLSRRTQSRAIPVKEMTQEEEMAEVECREREIETGQVQPLIDAEFWQRSRLTPNSVQGVSRQCLRSPLMTCIISSCLKW